MMLSRPPLQVVVWGPTPVKSTPKLLERQHKSFDSLLLFIFSRVYIKECQLGIFLFFLDTVPILSQQTYLPPPSMSLDMPNCNFRFLAKINKISNKNLLNFQTANNADRFEKSKIQKSKVECYKYPRSVRVVGDQTETASRPSLSFSHGRVM